MPTKAKDGVEIMQEISWGKLPRYFFKERETGLSINAAAMPCGIISESLPFKELFKTKHTLSPLKEKRNESVSFLRGFELMENIIFTSQGEANPMFYLCKLLLYALNYQGISNFEFIALKPELEIELPYLLMPFKGLQAKNIFFDANKSNNIYHKPEKLIILFEIKNNESNVPSLYAVRKLLLQNEVKNITITLQDAASFSIGTLYSLLQYTGMALMEILNTEQEKA